MKEYIDKAALMLHIAGVKIHLKGDSEWITGYRDALQAVGETVQNLPAADVVERKRGEWVVTEFDSGEPDGYPPFIEFHCPFCNEPYSLESGEHNWYYGDDIPLKFCHECGADMRSHHDSLCDQTEEVEHEAD